MCSSDLEGKVVQNEFSDEDERVVKGRAFSCTRLAFNAEKPAEKTKVSIWAAHGVKPPGIVLMIARTDKVVASGLLSTTLKLELEGYGTAEGVEWGEVPTKPTAPEVASEGS